jgi:hypothetical protein
MVLAGVVFFSSFWDRIRTEEDRIGVIGGEEEGGGVRSGSGAARTILHTISDRPSKQSCMVGSTLGVYDFGLIVVSARTNKRHHHQYKIRQCLTRASELIKQYYLHKITESIELSNSKIKYTHNSYILTYTPCQYVYYVDTPDITPPHIPYVYTHTA